MQAKKFVVKIKRNGYYDYESEVTPPPYFGDHRHATKIQGGFVDVRSEKQINLCRWHSSQ